MKWRDTSLFVRLTLSFLVVALVPVVAAGGIGFWSFRDSMTSEAQRAVADRMDIARDTVARRQGAAQSSLEALASDTNIAALLRAGDSDALNERLTASAGQFGSAAYVLAVDADGAIIASSSGSLAGSRSDDLQTRQALEGQTSAVFNLVPEEEVVAAGFGEATAIEVVETAGGSVIHDALDNRLAIVTATPVSTAGGDVAGALVSVSLVARTSDVVESIVSGTDSYATIFQHEVRVSTTVKDAEGNIAYGTVVSDPVRTTVYDRNETFVGRAPVVGRDTHTIYEVIRDPAGESIGMLFVGIPADPYIAAERLFVLRLSTALGLGLLVAFAAATVVARAFAAQLAKLAEAAARVADGDLTASAPEVAAREIIALATSFTTMTHSLRRIVRRVSGTADTMGQVASDLISTSRTQSDSAERQASAVTETTATLEEMAASYRSVASAAEEVMRRAESALGAASGGHELLERNLTSIERLAGGTRAAQTSAYELAEAAEDIGEILMLINQVAEQTKILALNAAIEAARAGDAGRGFAVVATEIRNLAESVSVSTSRIEELVTSIQRAGTGLVKDAAELSSEAEDAATTTRRSEDAFNDIVGQMASTAAAARQIATATSQQRTASEQVVAAMQDVSQAATESAVAAQQVEGAAERIAEESERLGTALGSLKA